VRWGMPMRSGWKILMATAIVAAACSRAAPARVERRSISRLALQPSTFDEPLWVGQAPLPVSVVAFDSAGNTMTLLHDTATAGVRDDSVARIIGSRVYALSRGRTTVDLELGGVHGDAEIRVADRAIHDSLRMVGGELRSWRLPPGYYEMRLDLPLGQQRGRGLELATYRANCANAPRHDGQHYFCVLKDGSSIIVQNVRSHGANSERSGELTVFRLP
jgi:hypothetical protein